MMPVRGPPLVLISGLPAVGKSTVAGPLAAALGGAWLSRDRVVQEMGPVLAPLDRFTVRAFGFRRRKLQQRANGLLAAMVERQLAAGRPVVVEAVADSEVRRQMETIAARRAAPLCCLTVVCPDAVEHGRRLAERTGHWEKVVRRCASSVAPSPGACVLDSRMAPGALVAQAFEFVRRTCAVRRG